MRLHKISVIMKPTTSSIHRLLMFVNAVNKDVAVGRFRVLAAGAKRSGKRPEEETGSLGMAMLASS